MELIPEAPEDVRERAASAYRAVQETLDSSATAAAARDRIRNIKSALGIAGLPQDLRDLWEWHVTNQMGFARLPFELQWKEFMFVQAEEAVPELGIPARTGRRGHDAFYAAGVPLLAWWEAKGRLITANLGPDRGNQQPCETVRFLAGEFLRMVPGLGPVRANQIGFKVAQRHVRNHTTFR